MQKTRPPIATFAVGGHFYLSEVQFIFKGSELRVYGLELEEPNENVFGVIYGAECLVNNKIYVGQTTRSIKERFREHEKSNTFIGKALRKYGLENFVVVILAECETKEDLDAKETEWIARLNCKAPFGYNFTDGGEGTPGAQGHQYTEEEKENLSAKLKGRKFTAQHKANISTALKGRKISDTARAKTSATLTGRKLPAAHRASISAGKKGKKKSAETRKKMSQAALNRPPEHNAKIADALKGNKNGAGNKGHHCSAETKAKISAGVKAYYASPPIAAFATGGLLV